MHALRRYPQKSRARRAGDTPATVFLYLQVLIHQISKFLDMRYVGGGLHGEAQLLDVRARAANGMDAVVRSAKLVFGVGERSRSAPVIC